MTKPQAIKAARERLGESQAAFGKRFGVDQSTIHRWETDGLPSRGITEIAVTRILAELPRPKSRERVGAT